MSAITFSQSTPQFSGLKHRRGLATLAATAALMGGGVSSAAAAPSDHKRVQNDPVTQALKSNCSGGEELRLAIYQEGCREAIMRAKDRQASLEQKSACAPAKQLQAQIKQAEKRLKKGEQASPEMVMAGIISGLMLCGVFAVACSCVYALIQGAKSKKPL